jgi:hypothetical protein
MAAAQRQVGRRDLAELIFDAFLGWTVLAAGLDADQATKRLTQAERCLKPCSEEFKHGKQSVLDEVRGRIQLLRKETSSAVETLGKAGRPRPLEALLQLGEEGDPRLSAGRSTGSGASSGLDFVFGVGEELLNRIRRLGPCPDDESRNNSIEKAIVRFEHVEIGGRIVLQEKKEDKAESRRDHSHDHLLFEGGSLDHIRRRSGGWGGSEKARDDWIKKL